MKETLESLSHKLSMAGELNGVVRTMKALSASNLLQYEHSVQALDQYVNTLRMGLRVCLSYHPSEVQGSFGDPEECVVIVFGSGQGLAGQFNEIVSHHASVQATDLAVHTEWWTVGPYLPAHLEQLGFDVTKKFEVPHAIDSINFLVEQILVNTDLKLESRPATSFYLCHNAPDKGTGYLPNFIRYLPLDQGWLKSFSRDVWPTRQHPEALPNPAQGLKSLLREYLFVSIYRASAESLASENISRLSAMERAEKNIADIIGELTQQYHQLRQSSIDEEMFDVIAGAQSIHNTDSQG